MLEDCIVKEDKAVKSLLYRNVNAYLCCYHQICNCCMLNVGLQILNFV